MNHGQVSQGQERSWVDGIAQGSAKALFALHDMRVGSKAAR